MDLGLKGKITIVTGAARGLGKSIAEVFANEGSALALCDIDLEELNKTAEALKVVTYTHKVDVSSEEDINSFIKSVMDKFGRVDVLVNNAGICTYKPTSQIDIQTWDKVMEINLRSVYLMSKAVIPILKEQKSGKIINMSSMAGKVGGLAVGADYSASKAAIISLTKSIAREGAPYGFTANAVAPAFIETRIMPKENEETYVKSIPLGRMGRPEEVAGVIAFLASKWSNFITGEVVDINGGALMD